MTADYIKEAYTKLKTKLGKQPSQREFYGNTPVSAHSLLTNGFRTYSQLVEEMGDSPKAFLKAAKTNEDFLISYGNMVRQLRKIPSTNDWKFNRGLPDLKSYLTKFKLSSWKNMAQEFYDFAKDKPEWADIIELLPQTNNVPLQKEVKESEECYVYLMFDTKTLCHKIGISNLPEWREKTLQSQKPSIKLIVAKKFVNRRIAANFEKALHDSYSHKKQRGEWFRLDQEDIDEIKATLES